MVERRQTGLLGGVTNQEITAVPTITIPTTARTTMARRRRRQHVPHFLRPAEFVRRRNTRERCRVHGVNRAFDTLRQHLPKISDDDKTSKITILRLAADYIMRLTSLLSVQSSSDSSSNSGSRVGEFVNIEDIPSRDCLTKVERMTPGWSNSGSVTQTSSWLLSFGSETPRNELSRGHPNGDLRPTSNERHCSELLLRNGREPPQGSKGLAGTFPTNPHQNLLSNGRSHYVISSPSVTSPVLMTNRDTGSSIGDATQLHQLGTTIHPFSEDILTNAVPIRQNVISASATSPGLQTSHAAFAAASSSADKIQTQRLRTPTSFSDQELAYSMLLQTDTVSLSVQHRATHVSPTTPPDTTFSTILQTNSSHVKRRYGAHEQSFAASSLRQQAEHSMKTTTDDGRILRGEISFGETVQTGKTVSLTAEHEFPCLQPTASSHHPKAEFSSFCHPLRKQDAALFLSSTVSGSMTSPHRFLTSIPSGEPLLPSSPYDVTSFTRSAPAATSCSVTLPPKAGSVLAGFGLVYPESSHVIQPEMRSASADRPHWIPV